MSNQSYGRIMLVLALVSAMQGVTAGQRPRAPVPPPTRPYGQLGGCPEEPAQYHRCAIAKAKSFTPPRTPHGKPDFQGFWTMAFGWRRNTEPGYELIENACVEGQQGRMPGESVGLKRYPGVTPPN